MKSGRLELELPRIDALGFGDHDPPLRQLDLTLRVSVRLTQPISLGLEYRRSASSTAGSASSTERTPRPA